MYDYDIKVNKVKHLKNRTNTKIWLVKLTDEDSLVTTQNCSLLF